MRVPLVLEFGQCLCRFGGSEYEVSLGIVRLVICKSTELESPLTATSMYTYIQIAVTGPTNLLRKPSQQHGVARHLHVPEAHAVHSTQ